MTDTDISVTEPDMGKRIRAITQDLDELIKQVSTACYSGSASWDTDRLENILANLKSAVDMMHSAMVEIMSARRV